MTRKEGSGLITAKGASRRPSCFPPETTAEVFRGNLPRINTARGFVPSFCDDRWRKDDEKPSSAFPTTTCECAWREETARRAFRQTRSCEHSVTYAAAHHKVERGSLYASVRVRGGSNRSAAEMAPRQRPRPTYGERVSLAHDSMVTHKVGRGVLDAPGT